MTADQGTQARTEAPTAPVRATGAPTLQDALAEGLSRKEALRLALRLSKAVAAWHARGLVHGRLTPRAVLLDSKGDVSLREPGESGEKALYLLRYASPEVARREDPGVAADVFSLGLIVRELLEGVPARRAEGEQVALEAVDGRVSVPHGLEGELHGIAVLAASPHAENRPSASQFVAALQGESQFKGFSGQEWIVAAVALAAVVMLVLLLRRSAAERDIAHQQFEDSRAAIEGLLAGTYPELDRVQDVAQLAEAGERALASIRVTADGERTAASEAALARALLWNGEAQIRLGADERAREHYEAAVEVAARVADPELDAEVRIPALLALSGLAAERHDRERAGSLLDQAVALGDQAGDTSHALVLSLAKAHLDRGRIALASGFDGWDEAREAFRETRAALDALGARPRDQNVLELRAALGRLEANMLALEEDREGSLAKLVEHTGLAERLVEMDPGSVDLRQQWARGTDSLGRAHMSLGQYPDAVTALRKSVEAWRLLSEMEPESKQWRAEWARSTRRLAEVLGHVGEAQEATALHDLSLEQFSSMLEKGEIRSVASLELAEHYLRAAEGLLAAGDLRRAGERLGRGTELLGQRAPSSRVEASWTEAIARKQVVTAELRLAEGSWAVADAALDQFVTIYQNLAQRGAAESLRHERVRALLASSAIRVARGRTEEATDLRERALAIADELVDADDHDIEALALLARCLFLLGRDDEAAGALMKLDEAGYRGLELSAVRAATARIRRR